MNHGNDPSSPWQQVVIHFDGWDAAEHSAVAHLGPLLTDAETSGLVASWFFIRKNPCWRLRFLPTDDTTTQDATTLIHQGLDSLHETGRIARWVATIYEPEAYAFGGPAAMDTAHHLFHQDSRHILAHLGSDRATASAAGVDQRRELSILLCSILMRGASQDWYEQGDIWARVTEHRCLPSDAPPDRLHAMESGLRRLMTVDTSHLARDSGPLAFLTDWAAVFDNAGTELGELARSGTLRRGLRAVLAHHVIFAWNRIGLSYTTQRLLATVAKAVALDH
ncbi:MAG: thiopeptide-type bacteriocin biosynthesis protein [Pseudonocardiaceae bacterium]